MTTPTAPHPVRRRRTTRATRARILDAALRELGRNPECSLGDIAEAAGVARRTVYTHFTGRAALVEGLAGEAAEAIRLAVADTHEATTHGADTHGTRTSGGDPGATGPGHPTPAPRVPSPTSSSPCGRSATATAR
ncbi:TetR/AcrR family transcriptional regulator [Streptomyces sp. MS1.AVA.1]|uniref:TetR/AcrR family transcriptional regulator n=1 Tax=Streptomyces machairae TaxID=3134109 RepID=A0ABU8UN48_9ACTN